MHRDVSHELQSLRIGPDQDAFEQWRQEFNTERPHESLDMATPADVYCPSERAYEGAPDEIDYEGMETRKVNQHSGTIKYSQAKIMLSRSIGGWDVGLGAFQGDHREVGFAKLLLGHLDTDTLAFIPIDTTLKETASVASPDSATLRREKQRESHIKHESEH